jgi:hypothetical protein
MLLLDRGGLIKELNIQTFETQILCMGKDPIKLILSEGAVEGLILLRQNRVILRHETEGQTGPKLQKQGGQSVQGVSNLTRENQVPDQDPFSSYMG